MTVAYPGVPDALAALRAAGHPLGLVTSKYYALARKALTHTGIEQHFGCIIGGDSIPNPKPHPEPVLRALTELGAVPEYAFMVGDSPHDIRAGNEAGVATIAVTWGPFTRERLAESNPTFWLSDIRDLPGMVGAGRG